MIMKYKRGTAIRLKVMIKDSDGTLYDPSTSVNVQLYDINGTEALASTSMTKASTGIYYYDWQTDSSATLGQYKQVVTAVDGTKTSIKDDSSAFEIYA